MLTSMFPPEQVAEILRKCTPLKRSEIKRLGAARAEYERTCPKGKLSPGAVAGIVIAVLAGVGGIGYLIYHLTKQNEEQKMYLWAARRNDEQNELCEDPTNCGREFTGEAKCYDEGTNNIVDDDLCEPGDKPQGEDLMLRCDPCTGTWQEEQQECLNEEGNEIKCGDGQADIKFVCPGGDCGPKPSPKTVDCRETEDCMWRVSDWSADDGTSTNPDTGTTNPDTGTTIVPGEEYDCTAEESAAIKGQSDRDVTGCGTQYVCKAPSLSADCWSLDETGVDAATAECGVGMFCRDRTTTNPDTGTTNPDTGTTITPGEEYNCTAEESAAIRGQIFRDVTGCGAQYVCKAPSLSPDCWSLDEDGVDAAAAECGVGMFCHDRDSM